MLKYNELGVLLPFHKGGRDWAIVDQPRQNCYCYISLRGGILNRHDFESLRDLPGKTIRADIRFAQKRQTSPLLVIEDLKIENSLDLDVRLSIHFNPEVGSKTINVHRPGVGPICRLDVDGAPHRPAGRSHKHSLQSERCPDRNLPDGVIDRPDLAGQSLQDVFRAFCQMSQINYQGTFEDPPATQEELFQ
jgi:hypothetical protein